MGKLHEVMTNVVLFVVGLHVLGALFQEFVLHSDGLRRMLPFGGCRPADQE